MKFEEALKQLEETVEQLETGELSLEKSLEMFETGVKMSRICTKQLEDAEQKVELLLNVADDGQIDTAAFDTQTLEE